MLINKRYQSTLTLNSAKSNPTVMFRADCDHTLQYQFLFRGVKLQSVRMAKKREERTGRSAESRRTDVMKAKEQEPRAGGPRL